MDETPACPGLQGGVFLAPSVDLHMPSLTLWALRACVEARGLAGRGPAGCGIAYMDLQGAHTGQGSRRRMCCGMKKDDGTHWLHIFFQPVRQVLWTTRRRSQTLVKKWPGFRIACAMCWVCATNAGQQHLGQQTCLDAGRVKQPGVAGQGPIGCPKHASALHPTPPTPVGSPEVPRQPLPSQIIVG